MWTILATGLETNSIDQIASMTDKILELSGRSTPLKSKPKANSTNSKTETATGDTEDRLDNLTKCLKELG